MAGLIAVTGASGFLGRRLVPALAQGGWRVRVLCRRDPAGLWGDAAPQVVLGDLADEAAIAALTEGADVVVHAAGAIKALDKAGFLAVNVDGSRRVAEQARRARMVLVSSLAARSPALSDYAASKRAAEDAAAHVLGERLTILRPPAIYGPGDRETLALFRIASRSPVLPRLGAPQARLALSHVDETVGAIAALARAPLAGRFAIGGARPEGYVWDEILQAAARAFDRRPLIVPVPAGLVRTAGALAGMAARLRGRADIFGPGKVRELLHPDWSVPADERLPASHAPAPVRLDEGFAMTARWYESQGWI